MESVAYKAENEHVFGYNGQPDITILQKSFLNLVKYAEDNLPKGSREVLFSDYLTVLEDALSNVREATAVLNSIAELGRPQSETAVVDESALREQLRDSELPACGDLILDFAGIETISSATVARFFEVKRKLLARGGRLIFENVSLGLREAVDALQIDRFFEVRYARNGIL